MGSERIPPEPMEGVKGLGMEAIPEIRRIDPDVAIVVLSGLLARDMADQAMERGADEYVEKGTSIQEMREVIRSAVSARRAA